MASAHHAPRWIQRRSGRFILAMTVGLIRAEAADDLRTLTVTGRLSAVR